MTQAEYSIKLIPSKMLTKDLNHHHHSFYRHWGVVAADHWEVAEREAAVVELQAEATVAVAALSY